MKSEKNTQLSQKKVGKIKIEQWDKTENRAKK